MSEPEETAQPLHDYYLNIGGQRYDVVAESYQVKLDERYSPRIEMFARGRSVFYALLSPGDVVRDDGPCKDPDAEEDAR